MQLFFQMMQGVKMRETIKLWKNEYNCFEFRYIENDKGLCIIKKLVKCVKGINNYNECFCFVYWKIRFCNFL